MYSYLFYLCLSIITFTYTNAQPIKIGVEISSKKQEDSNSELIINANIKNHGFNNFFLFKGKKYCSTDDYSSFFWVFEIRFKDSIRVEHSCGLVNVAIHSKREYFKLKRDSVTSLTFSIDLKKIVFPEYSKDSVAIRDYPWGEYSIILKYVDRDKINNKNEVKVFESNKIYFNYQK